MQVAGFSTCHSFEGQGCSEHGWSGATREGQRSLGTAKYHWGGSGGCQVPLRVTRRGSGSTRDDLVPLGSQGWSL